MEVHSAWGTFEWLLTDGFALGHRCGVVCNSDGHKGRPGASYPGASMFGAYGGLTCFLTEELTRDGIFDCLRKRHHYGTTGNRLHLTVNASFETPAKLFDKDPAAFEEATGTDAIQVMMGDIVQYDGDTTRIDVSVKSPSPVERVEIRNGLETLQTFRGYGDGDLGNRFRVIWSGAEYRGRGRNVLWNGQAVFKGAKITRMEKINAWNHERLLEARGDDTIAFEAITTGNFGGFDVWLENWEGASLDLVTDQGTLNVSLSRVGLEDTAVACGGLEKQLKVFRLPDESLAKELRASLEVPLHANGDNQLWVCVTTEDGFQAWSSPIFVFKET